MNASTEQDIQTDGFDDAFKRARDERAAVAGASIGVRATIKARVEAARQAPGAERRMKTWVADTDRHADLDGETVPLGGTFSQGFDPGGPINCQCTAVIT